MVAKQRIWILPGHGVFAAAVLGLGLACATTSRADTVHMKDGGIIPECRILEDDGEKVHLRTPGGKMGVPKAVIDRIEKKTSVFDAYDQQLAKIKKGDLAGLFTLAQWCQKTAGMRPEMCELLERTMEVEPNYAPVRRMLGHIRIDGNWQVPEPLLIRLQIEDKSLRDELEAQMSILFETRKDVRIADSLEGLAKTDGCDLLATVEGSETGEVTFYGQKVRGAKGGAKVRLKAQAGWVPAAGSEIAVTGEVSAGTSSKRLAFIDAINRNAEGIHRFFDRLVQQRAAVVEAAAAPKGPTPKQAAPKAKGAAKKSEVK